MKTITTLLLLSILSLGCQVHTNEPLQIPYIAPVKPQLLLVEYVEGQKLELWQTPDGKQYTKLYLTSGEVHVSLIGLDYE